MSKVEMVSKVYYDVIKKKGNEKRDKSVCLKRSSETTVSSSMMWNWSQFR